MDANAKSPQKMPRGMTAMGIFLSLGATTASLAGITLVRQGTFLDPIWTLNPRAYAELTPLGKGPGLGFLFLGGLLALTAWGWFRRRVWGWWLALTMIAAQVLGGLVHIFMARIAEGAVGVSIAGLLLIYLLQSSVRTAFRSEG